MEATVFARFITEGLRFFSASFALALILLLAAPLDIVRVFCAFVLACSAAGFALHLSSLRATDPEALAALLERAGEMFKRLRSTAARALAALGDAPDTVWPCVLR